MLFKSSNQLSYVAGWSVHLESWWSGFYLLILQRESFDKQKSFHNNLRVDQWWHKVVKLLLIWTKNTYRPYYLTAWWIGKILLANGRNCFLCLYATKWCGLYSIFTICKITKLKKGIHTAHAIHHCLQIPFEINKKKNHSFFRRSL